MLLLLLKCVIIVVSWCQRYYEITDYFNGVCTTTSVTAGGLIPFKVTKRAAPTIGVSGAMTVTDGFTASYTQSSASVGLQYASIHSMFIFFGNFTGLVLGRVYFTNNSSSSSVFQISSEL